MLPVRKTVKTRFKIIETLHLLLPGGVHIGLPAISMQVQGRVGVTVRPCHVHKEDPAAEAQSARVHPFAYTGFKPRLSDSCGRWSGKEDCS